MKGRKTGPRDERADHKHGRKWAESVRLSSPQSYPARVAFSDMSGDNATLNAQPPKGGTGFITKLIKGQTVVVGAIDIASPTPAPSVALPMSGGSGKHVYVNAGGGDVMTPSERIAGVKARHAFQARASDMLDAAGAGDRAARRWCSVVLGGFTLPADPPPAAPDDAAPTPSATRAGDGSRLRQSKPTGAGSASAPLAQLVNPDEFVEAMGMPAALEAAQDALEAAQEAEKSAKPGEKRKAKEKVRAAQESLDHLQDRSDEILSRLATALVGARRAADVDVEIRAHPETGEPHVYVVTRAATTRTRRVNDEWRQTLVIQRAVAKILGLTGELSVTRRSAHTLRQSGHSVHVSTGIATVDVTARVRVEKLSRGSVTVFVSGRGQQIFTRREIEAAMEG